LHLVGILFPHINDDARSKSLQIDNIFKKFNTFPFIDFMCFDGNLKPAADDSSIHSWSGLSKF